MHKPKTLLVYTKQDYFYPYDSEINAQNAASPTTRIHRHNLPHVNCSALWWNNNPH